jgi:hypothetical protein
VGEGRFGARIVRLPQKEPLIEAVGRAGRRGLGRQVDQHGSRARRPLRSVVAACSRHIGAPCARERRDAAARLNSPSLRQGRDPRWADWPASVVSTSLGARFRKHGAPSEL